MLNTRISDQNENNIPGLDFHHVGVIVEDIEFSLKHFGALFGKESISKVIHVSSQKVNVCFIKNGEDTYLELIQPLGNDSVVFKLLQKRISYYHVAYKVKNIHLSMKHLEALNYKALKLFNSEAFDGKLCVFMFSPDGLLVELIEK